MERIQQKSRTYATKVKTRATQPSSWAIPRHESSVAPPGVWSNLDYDPVPVERQIWTSTTVLTYWFSDMVSIVGWSQASAMYAVGLSATDATLACMVAGICISFPIAMVIWLAVKGRGGDEFFHRPAQIHGAARAWQWLAGMTSVTGGCSTLALNNSDWSRFSKKPSSQFWQFLVLPLFLTTVGLCGIVGASASEKIWGTSLWNPLDIVEKWNRTPGGRAAAFFSAALWLLAQVSINLSTNSVAFATDIGTLAPKLLNIRRASFLGFLIGGWALCPWIILKSAQTFLSFMAAYSIFMAPITGILLTDFYLV
ncbi:hypothetical protein LTR67_011104 [Exophiala xenobiotica]